MADGYRIRPTAPADLPALGELEGSAFSDPWSLAMLEEALAARGAIALVAESGGGVIGSILNQILGGRSYGQNERYAVEQCVRAVEYRINTRGLDNEGGRYRQYGYGYGYNNGYANNHQGARVVSVNQVSRRSDGGLKVYGYASTGMPTRGGNYGYNGYGYDNYGYGQYGYQQQADARFNCSIDRYGRIKDIDAERNYGGNYPYRRY